MQEIAPGVFHWNALHPNIKMRVSSYFLADEGVVLDPMLPPEGLEWFEEHAPPAAVVLTNRHHHRRSADFVEEFGCAVFCHSAGLHEFTEEQHVQGFEDGDEPVAGIEVKHVGSICPDEVAIYVPRAKAIAFADGVVRWRRDDPLGFVPDSLFDDAEHDKAGIRDSVRALLPLEPDHLLLAHGEPIVGGGTAALQAFLAR
ncbi:MAG: hypothetical protein JWN32_579 [Solirubrobacterales bacterium]|jgi:hypothetical protein|nr:hypothetical protein [Solirubrobacterales bacterium]